MSIEKESAADRGISEAYGSFAVSEERVIEKGFFFCIFTSPASQIEL